MSGAPQHAASQWLCKVLQPVIDKYSSHCVKASFTCCDELKSSQLPVDGFMCSFDVVSLFTNVPLVEVIDICANVLYSNECVGDVQLSESSFRKLMKLVTSGVEFSFDNYMCRQADGVAMGSPLGPVLANIFMGYCDSLIPLESYPLFYRRYVDDTFSYFLSKDEAIKFKCILDGLHPYLKFTCEFEKDHCLSFLDVLVDRSSHIFNLSVYRKPTFTGLLTTWDSFCSLRFKLSLIRNLVHCARHICSANRLQSEFDNIRQLLRQNGYPEDIIGGYVKEQTRNKDPVFGPKKCRVILRLPWYGSPSQYVEKAVRSIVSSCYFAVDVLCVFVTSCIFGGNKDVLPTHTLSNIIYNFECRNCSSRYIGRTSARLQDRIRQHVPRGSLTGEAKKDRPRQGRPRSKAETPEETRTEQTRTTE